MSDEPEMKPVTPAEGVAAPKAPVVGGIKKPLIGSGLRPGLKLPPKPGLASGLKLPPKPVLGSGVKLPPKPGVAPVAAVAAKPAGAATAVHRMGLKTMAMNRPKGIVRPPVMGAKPVVPSVAKPAAPSVEPVSEIPAKVAVPIMVKAPVVPPPPPAAVPEAAQAQAEPVGIETPSTPVAPVSEALKKATQDLKAVTSIISAQAAVKKATGKLPEGVVTTPTQVEAAKSKTSRISLDAAMGVAPVMESASPMKTIRLKKPELLSPRPTAAAPAGAAEAPAATSATAGASVTQKKTLKISRPSSLGIKKPMGIKRPGVSTGATTVVKTDPAAPASGDVADIPDIPDMPAAPLPNSFAAQAAVAAQSKGSGVPKWLAVTGMLSSIAAVLVVGVLAWFVRAESTGPSAGPNDMASFQSDSDARSSLRDMLPAPMEPLKE